MCSFEWREKIEKIRARRLRETVKETSWAHNKACFQLIELSQFVFSKPREKSSWKKTEFHARFAECFGTNFNNNQQTLRLNWKMFMTLFNFCFRFVRTSSRKTSEWWRLLEIILKANGEQKSSIMLYLNRSKTKFDIAYECEQVLYFDFKIIIYFSFTDMCCGSVSSSLHSPTQLDISGLNSLCMHHRLLHHVASNEVTSSPSSDEILEHWHFRDFSWNLIDSIEVDSSQLRDSFQL